ncbi:NUDIX domain-containing protein [Bradyrhizobium sp. KBS0727]|uniref:NUDIX domain-containing protein n=1 Tax=unclassified Bradyrhizobium TaxID=2631580 RepID=UPI00110E35A7|nr:MULTISPECIES: NUDIX domain-containing protein [unclassified Bradyrhizobium]QDW39808.1 NUDIX domain-containing protein [Bradyrhizobium sp. KBS0725]QDW46411.1 NUDIX domain-containing protein [Bradyrhizobium sp. KBS0727]
MPKRPQDELNEISFNLVLDKFTRRAATARKDEQRQNLREIAAAVIFDTSDRLLLQLRDDKPDILYPGKVALFGGHREGDETFLECVVREIHEELGYFIPPARFEKIAQRSGPDFEIPGGTFCAEFFVVRDVPAEQLIVTEGTLKIVELNDLPAIVGELTPSALFALTTLALT